MKFDRAHALLIYCTDMCQYMIYKSIAYTFKGCMQ